MRGRAGRVATARHDGRTSDDRHAEALRLGCGAWPRPLLEVRNLVVRYGKKGAAAVDDVSFTIARGETLGLVGESGSGQDDDRSRHPRSAARHERADPLRGQRHHAGERRRAPGAAGRPARRVPGSVLVAQSAPADRRRASPSRCGSRGVPRAERDRRVKEVLARRRPRARVRSPLSAPVLGRPASAHRDRPGAGHRSAPRRLRRGGQRARPLDAGAGAEPPGGAACRSRARLPLHRARHGGGGVPRSARRRAQPRADHGAGRRRSKCWATRSITTPACSWPHRRFPIPTSRPAGEGCGRSSRRPRRRPEPGPTARGSRLTRCVSGTWRPRAETAPAPSRGTCRPSGWASRSGCTARSSPARCRGSG